MSWWFFPAHYVAHVQPSLAQGTADGNYPLSICRTLDINLRAKLTPHATNGLEIRWDRGAGTNRAAIDSILILNNTMSGSNWSVDGDDDAGFTSPTALISASTNIQRDIWQRFDGAVSNAERYVRFRWAQTAPGPYNFGLISLGKSYQLTLGPQISSENFAAIPGPTESWSREFYAVVRATVQTMVDLASRDYVYDGGGTVQDAFGGGGGLRPVAVVDDSTNPDTVYYGLARVSGKPRANNYSALNVDFFKLLRPGLHL